MKTVEVWPRCAPAAAFFERQLREFLDVNPSLQELADRLSSVAGVNLVNLVDHWVLPENAPILDELCAIGLELTSVGTDAVWFHSKARLPRVRLDKTMTEPLLALQVEDVWLFLHAQNLQLSAYEGDSEASYEFADCLLDNGVLRVVARRGDAGFQATSSTQISTELNAVRTAFRNRVRLGEELSVIAEVQKLARNAIKAIGRDRAVDEFFAAERAYYLTRNAAARWQYEQQQTLGIGWANHDHHTYRSSRAGFQALMQLWETFGFVMRERFYAGADAGWGAQIAEHPVSRVVIFCDVDMAPDELDIDFSSQSLSPRDHLGTIGLWCALHGSSICDAGMHHLECEFDFEAAKRGFEAAGFGVMAPFTDLPMLKQAFTQPEIWRVSERRLHSLLRKNLIRFEQAERFLTYGAPGSHLEILQRWEGFKGFNKTGVSAIIRETDARR